MSKKPAKKNKYPEVHETIEAKHEFTSDEKIGLLDSLSHAHQELSGIKDQAKHSAADYKNRAKAVENRISDLSNKATSGYELRPVECRVDFDPKKGVKHYLNRKTKEKIETRDMQPSDYELQLPMSGEKVKAGEGLTSVAAAFPEADNGEGGEAEE